jgi:hypothetical protein
MIVSVFASFGLADCVLYPGTKALHPMIWGCFAMAALVFIMGCIGLFILIITKAHITISKQFAVEKQPEVKTNKKK